MTSTWLSVLRMRLTPGLRAAALSAGTLDRLDLAAVFKAASVDSDWRAVSEAHSGPAEPRLLSVDIKDVNHTETAAWRAFQLPQSPAAAMGRLGYGDLVQFRVARGVEVLREAGEPYDLIFPGWRSPAQDCRDRGARGTLSAAARRIPAAARLFPGAPPPLARRQSDRRAVPGGAPAATGRLGDRGPTAWRCSESG
jgi:hypothetical protein